MKAGVYYNYTKEAHFDKVCLMIEREANDLIAKIEAQQSLCETEKLILRKKVIDKFIK